ncbi:molybdenum ABC transporter ATP-binding protein [Radicibacter daui]|uniref:molybdenum ABC transporter ATP-binding protein n=1 Tax=Radicibacter daui TaxID=3064829 RepID=UPI0040469C7A
MSAARLDLDLTLKRGALDLCVRTSLALDGITALFGPSGSGKTSLLRLVAGLEAGGAGRIAFNGAVWQESAAGTFIAPHRRGVGLVFQEARLFDHLGVEGNLRYAARRAPAGGEAPEIRWDDVIAAFDLAPLLPRRVVTLSGGERQRVAIARALLARPSLLLMDEPVSALDLARKSAILPYIAALPRRFGVPVLYVTHALDEVAHLARQMVVMGEGRIAAVGPTAGMLERLDLQPLTGRFEAGSLLEGVVEAEDRALAMLTLRLAGGHRLRLPAAGFAGTGPRPGEEVRLRVLARDVSLALAAPEGISIRNILPATVLEVAEEPGPYAELLLALAPGEGEPAAHLRARITREALGELGLAVGKPVFALIKSVSFDR